MNILFSPLREDNLYYQVVGEIIYVKYFTNLGKFDLSNVPNGRLSDYSFPINFISSAVKKDDELTVTIRQPVDANGEPLGTQIESNLELIDAIDFTWRTQQEIEDEKNAPKPPTPEERITELEQQKEIMQGALDFIIMYY